MRFIGGPSNIYKETLAEIVSKVNSKMWTIFAKRSNLDAWLSPDCASAGGQNTSL